MGESAEHDPQNGLSRRVLLGGTIGAGLAAAGIGGADVAAAAPRPGRAPGLDEAEAVPDPADLSRPLTPLDDAAALEELAQDSELLADLRQLHGAPMPKIYTRAQWRAAAPRRAATVLSRAPDHIVIHHTATSNSAGTSLAQAFSLSRSIQRYHMKHNKWDDVGQQLTISRGGHVMEGRNQSLTSILSRRLVVGAQTLHHNGHTLGIESEGFYMTVPPPRALWLSLIRTTAWLCTVYGLDPTKALVGHRDYNRTSCPGNAFYTRLPLLRQAVAVVLGTRTIRPPVRPPIRPVTGSTPRPPASGMTSATGSGAGALPPAEPFAPQPGSPPGPGSLQP